MEIEMDSAETCDVFALDIKGKNEKDLKKDQNLLTVLIDSQNIQGFWQYSEKILKILEIGKKEFEGSMPVSVQKIVDL